MSTPAMMDVDVLAASSQAPSVTSVGLAAALSQFTAVDPRRNVRDPGLAGIVKMMRRVTGSSSEDDAKRDTNRATDRSDEQGEVLDGANVVPHELDSPSGRAEQRSQQSSGHADRPLYPQGVDLARLRLLWWLT